MYKTIHIVYLKQLPYMGFPYKTKEMRQAYISEHNDKCNNQVNLLMITDGTSNWHYLAIKNIWIIKRSNIKS